MLRLFVALDLPENIQNLLRPMCCGLVGARWVPHEQIHLTLRFIGEVDGAMFLSIGQALEEIQIDPFTLQLDGVGFFPPRGKPRVLWVGVQRNEELHRLQKRVESTLVACGLEPERRKYSPHITLARLKNTPLARAGRYHAHHALFMSPPFSIDNFALYSSTLSKNGAKHYLEAQYPLVS